MRTDAQVWIKQQLPENLLLAGGSGGARASVEAGGIGSPRVQQ